MSRHIRAAAPFVITLLVTGAPMPCRSYTGGPIRVSLAGYDAATHRVYYRQQAFDEGWFPPEVYFFDLDGEAPDRPLRERSLEQADAADWESHPNPDWLALSRRLQRITSGPTNDLCMSVAAESTGVNAEFGVPRYELMVRVTCGTSSGELAELAFCGTGAGIRGVYAIPGRPERLVVLSYQGRPHGCEEVEKPVVLRDR